MHRSSNVYYKVLEDDAFLETGMVLISVCNRMFMKTPYIQISKSN